MRPRTPLDHRQCPNLLKYESYAANNIVTIKNNYRDNVLGHKIEEVSDFRSNANITNLAFVM